MILTEKERRTLTHFSMVGLNADWISRCWAIGDYFIFENEESENYTVLSREPNELEGTNEDTEHYTGTVSECLAYLQGVVIL